MISPAPATPRSPTIWGLTPTQVHDRFWASRGVQVVRPGEPSEIVESAELFLLIDAHSLVVFRLRDLVEVLSWLKPKLLAVRVRDDGHEEYKEVVRSGADGAFEGFERIYEGLDSRHARVGLTPHRDVAQIWQSADSSSDGWKRLRSEVPADAREARRVSGRLFDTSHDQQVMDHIECLMDSWWSPETTIPRVARSGSGVWADRDASVSSDVSAVGTVWVGAGREVEADEVVVGPAVLWDAPDAVPANDSVPWLELEPVPVSGGLAAPPGLLSFRRAGKRLFDIVFSSLVLLFTLPLYPFIALAIVLEDGFPVFFAHQRETVGGREFPCLKFRSMRRDAEQIKADLESQNVSDGPQFFVENDPRMTRVGRFLRATQLDEIPQFLNVLAGHMSVVGPRPSPRGENQFCPGWRETRLSVRPGVTGLWQVQRTREEGLDFQEWIRYDVEYVERMSWRLDLWVIWKTLGVVFDRGD